MTSDEPQGGWADIASADGSRFRAHLAAPPAGTGPGLILLPGAADTDASIAACCRRFADEGYAVVAPDLTRHYSGGALAPAGLVAALSDIFAARARLAPHLEAAAKTGAIAIAEGGILAWRLAASHAVDAIVIYGPPPAVARDAADGVPCPAALHFAGAASIDGAGSARARWRIHDYPDCKPGFFDPLHADFDAHAATVAHSRTLAILRPALGPHYDLAQLLRDHLHQEFVAHDADATMETMVGAPYVNHVPTMTGGVGHDTLKRFYKYHFIPNLPKSRRSILLSETVGADTVVFETVTKFLHTEEIDYLLPGIKPTGKAIEVATVVIAKFRGDKLYHEHIYWDQASILVQLGLIDPKGLPVAGAAAARKMLDQSLPANELMARWRESEDKPI